MTSLTKTDMVRSRGASSSHGVLSSISCFEGITERMEIRAHLEN